MPIPASFQAEHPDIHHWIMTNLEVSRWARDVLERVVKRGHITEREAWRIRYMIDRERRQSLGLKRTRSHKAEAIVAMTRR